MFQYDGVSDSKSKLKMSRKRNMGRAKQATALAICHTLCINSVFDQKLSFITSTIISLQYTMYPKVKVRTEGQDDQHAHAAHEYNWNSLLSFKDIQFLLLQDSYFPVKEFRDVSPSPTARIRKPSLPNIILQTESASEEADKKRNFDEEDRPNIKAGSVLRPRAVLSSPDNDTMIGNKNKVKATRPSALKNHHSVQSRHAQCKVASSQAVDDSRLNTRKSKDTTDTNLKGKKWSTTAISSQRRNITTDKPRSVRFS